MDGQQSVGGKLSQSLHFSDGVFDLANEHNEECSDSSKSNNILLRVIDWCGEKLAWSFGISSPKYYYIIENAKMRASERDFIDLGDMDDPHVAILQVVYLFNINLTCFICFKCTKRLHIVCFCVI
ncbi:hypothetical protein Smp_073140.1 [Schistosoma mansoni]|uniref:hypothetical protein n=1 Tax=Schistosoma mansoni TaxID=6183 RepID=UPI0001A61F71|nr:hypothetical protein Smp_073140.1 [Schistosoma mansoni]|eukprot:XP_018648289.1 hypothetical protein Smp_073140.1 [Schistosoma mansoni]